jgi:hypothetical protein
MKSALLLGDFVAEWQGHFDFAFFNAQELGVQVGHHALTSQTGRNSLGKW